MGESIFGSSVGWEKVKKRCPNCDWHWTTRRGICPKCDSILEKEVANEEDQID